MSKHAGKYDHLNKKQLLEAMAERGYSELARYKKWSAKKLRYDLEYDDTFVAVPEPWLWYGQGRGHEG